VPAAPQFTGLNPQPAHPRLVRVAGRRAHGKPTLFPQITRAAGFDLPAQGGLTLMRLRDSKRDFCVLRPPAFLHRDVARRGAYRLVGKLNDVELGERRRSRG
jgi:hypothetical protein